TDRTVGRRRDVVDDVLILRIRVMMFALIPFRSVSDLRQEQRRLNRIENLGRKQLLISRHAAGANDIGKIFFRAPLDEQFLADLRAPSRGRENFDVWKLSLKFG